MNNELQLPTGFLTAGGHCGVKKDPAIFDLALFVSNVSCTSAGVFTQNRVCGAPVKVSRERIRRTTTRGVVINSGNSNACTGDQGIADARWMTGLLAEKIGCPAEDVLVCSTGVIGRFLPKDPLVAGIPQLHAQLAATPEAFEQAARGMLTTDTCVKMATRTVTIAGTILRISGCCKGAAMIAPNMATMLCVIMTDAKLTVDDADAMLRNAVNESFNCISVEGHTSTSDTVLFLANGAAGGTCSSTWTHHEQVAYQQALTAVSQELARAIINDAEGATHTIFIEVRGCRNKAEAKLIAKAIADSPLVKTAIHGADPNWGRIVSAAGYAGVPFEECDATLRVNGMLLYRNGTPVKFDPATASKTIRDSRETHIELDFSLGITGARYWTADLTAEYVRLNADYTT